MNKRSTAASILIVIMLILPPLAQLDANSFQLVLLDPMIPAPTPTTRQVAGLFPAFNSYNWGGYAVAGPAGSVSDVKGSWTVPTYTGATCTANQLWDAVFWIGIDGFSSKTVEQTGTETGCFEGTVYYDAWYEFYPASWVIISHPVYAGDSMSAEVKYVSTLGKFTVSITDNTQAWTFSIKKADSEAKRSSAEWIAESPFGSIGELPLADFGTVYFTGDTAVTTTHSGMIGSFPSTSVAIITAVCYPSGAPDKSTTSTLTNSGADFSIGWLNAGPQG